MIALMISAFSLTNKGRCVASFEHTVFQLENKVKISVLKQTACLNYSKHEFLIKVD